MPAPSERKRLEDIEKARKAVAKEIVRRYEHRRSRGDERFSFAVRLAPTDKDYRDRKTRCGNYDPRDVASREAFLAVVSDLERSCGMGVKRDSTGAPVSLVVNEALVRHAYDEMGRSFRDVEELASFLSFLDETAHACVDLPWALAWIEGVAAQAKSPGGLAKVRSRVGADAEEVCAALRVYAGGDFRGWRRVLSAIAYGDSKYFENSVAASFVKAAEAGGLSFGSSSDTDDKLAALGFRSERYSSVTVGGNVAVHPTWAAFDLSRFGCEGIPLSLSAVEGFAESSFAEVKGCLVVENLTVFRALCSEPSEGLLVVWGHGRPNEAVRRLVGVLDVALPAEAPFLAWSDIDLGGFGIVEALMSISGRIKPIMMGRDDLQAVDASRLLRRREEYWADMRKFVACHSDSLFLDVAQACLELQGTLEQEALLFEYAQERIRGFFDA